MKFLALVASLLVLAGCASGPRYDTSHPSANYDSRIQFVVVHYTSASLERSLQLLTHGDVSSHYLIGDDKSATVYKLMDENQRAWHAGESQWQGRTWLNSSSIGIEIVNPGYKDTPTGRLWYPYSEAQIQSLITLLKDISKRNGISPRHIIGHSDIAPLRKLDPGPLFPWKRLAAEGLACGRTSKRWRVSRRCSTATRCRRSAGSRRNSRVWVTTHRRPASWTSPRATSSPRSRCITALPASTARRMRKPQHFFWSSIRQNNDARPTVRAKSQSAAITHGNSSENP